MDCDEHIILKKLRDGDSEALDILYLRYASKAFGNKNVLPVSAYPGKSGNSAGDSGPSFRFGAICSA